MTDSARLRGGTHGRFVALPMPSFRQISAAFPALLIDAASSQIQVGVLPPAGVANWHRSGDEAGVAVFQAIAALNVDLAAVRTFIFCDGPGSVLGIRTVAMALRTWNVLQPRPVFAYSSLALVAHARGRPELGVIADARRETWHHFRIGQSLRRVPVGELSGELAMPAGFRHWSALPASVASTPYDVADLLPRVWDIDLLRPTDSPDAFLHEEPGYVTWTPRIHQAAAP